MNAPRAIHFRRVPLRIAFVLAVLATATVTAASEESVDLYFVCRDGQELAGSSMDCDLDGLANERCTFGETGGKSITVAAGESARRRTSQGMMGELTCEAAVEEKAAPPGPKRTSKRIAGSKRAPSGSSCGGTRVLAPKFVYPRSSR